MRLEPWLAVRETLTWEVTISISSWTLELANPIMKSINEPVSFKAIKHAGRRIFIITSINLFRTIEAVKECWQATCFHIIRGSGVFFKRGISYNDFYFWSEGCATIHLICNHLKWPFLNENIQRHFGQTKYGLKRCVYAIRSTAKHFMRFIASLAFNSESRFFLKIFAW